MASSLRSFINQLKQGKRQKHLRQQEKTIDWWRGVLLSEAPKLREALPIPCLSELSKVEQLQAQVMAHEIAVIASPQSIGYRTRPSVFSSDIKGLAALKILYPQVFPRDLFAVTLEEAGALNEKMPRDFLMCWPQFSFQAIFERLESASSRVLNRVPAQKQVALACWATFSKSEILLYTYSQKSGLKTEYERTDIYSWNGDALQMREQQI